MHVVGWVADWEAAERYLIKKMRDAGYALLNVEDGGRGSYAVGNHKPKSSTMSLFKLVTQRVGMRARANREAGDTERSGRMLRLLDAVRKQRARVWVHGGDDAVSQFDRDLANDIMPLIMRPEMISAITKLVGA